MEPARQSAKWFSERTQVLRTEVEGSAAKLAAYQQQKGIVSLDERLDTENARLEQYNAQLSQAIAQTADAESRQRLAAEAQARGVAPDSVPEVVGNTLVQSLKAELTRKEGQLQDLSIRYGTNHPQYRAAAAEVQSTRQKISGAMADVVASLGNNMRIAQRREAELRSQVGTQKTRVLALKKERDELAALMREAENAQRAFDATTQRYTQTSLESQATQTNIAVLSPAVEPIEPSFPKWPLNIALAVFLGGLLGVGVALLMEMLDQRVRAADSRAHATRSPIPSTLPGRGLPRPRIIHCLDDD